MTEAEALQFAMYALGGCVVAIGSWIATSIKDLGDKMGRALVVLEAHESRLSVLENESDYRAPRRASGRMINLNKEGDDK